MPDPIIPDCAGCGPAADPLVPLQPDPGRPDRVWGYCLDCGAMHRLTAIAGGWRLPGRLKAEG